ncbi:MAG: gfo/Idh/MocA family oxidoreductase, partial [Armatimonadetes bacterium]|nr:gfo/Idh/MocA family oxidoreductase [Armatimonadota bacterium]
MSQKRVRVGVIGLGVGEQHLLGFLQDSRCEVTTLCDLTPDHARAVAHRLGAAVRVT